MTKTETGYIMMMLKALYPNWGKSLTSQDVEMTIEMWFEMLEEFDYDLVKLGIKAFGSSPSPFPPSVGELISKIKMLTSTEKEMSEVEAWGIVKKAISNSTYNSASEFEKLPKIIQDTIVRHETLKDWASNSVTDIDTVIGSNFMRSYKATVTKNKQYEALPKDVKQQLTSSKDLIKQLADKMSM